MFNVSDLKVIISYGFILHMDIQKYNHANSLFSPENKIRAFTLLPKLGSPNN